MNMNQPIDMEAARRNMAASLKEAACALVDFNARISAIDAITDRAAALGICRARWEFDPRFGPVSAFGKIEKIETRGRKPLNRIPGSGDIGRI